MQSDTNSSIPQLKKALLLVPPNVSVPKDVTTADEVISAVSRILGAGPASRPAVHPKPVSAGVAWDDVSTDTQIKYDAVVDLLSDDSPHVQLDSAAIDEALGVVREGLKQLAKLPQQGYSGMVQRNS